MNSFNHFFFFLLLLLSASSAASLPMNPIPFSNPSHPFQNLSNCHLGDQNPILTDLKTYLHRFGYLSSSNFTDSFDAALQSALRSYQQNHGLNSSGLLDPSTISLLISPRCGVPDVIVNASSAADRGRHLFTFFPRSPTWPPSRRHLTYALTSTSAISIPRFALRPAFHRAFARWAAVTTLTFTEVNSDSNPDIKIGFYAGDHGDGYPFDGVLRTLAHASPPTYGRFHLDAAERWVVEWNVEDAASIWAVDLEAVAMHEIGHLVGLGHSPDEESIMYAMAKWRKVELTKDDVEGVQRLYGSNPNFTGVTPATAAGSLERGRRVFGLVAVVVAGILVLLL